MLVIAAWTSRMFGAVLGDYLVDGDEMDALLGLLRTLGLFALKELSNALRALGLFALKNWSNAPEVRKMYVVLST